MDLQLYELKLITVSKRDRTPAIHHAVYLGRVEPVAVAQKRAELIPLT